MCVSRWCHAARLSSRLSSEAWHASSNISFRGGKVAVEVLPKSRPTSEIQALATWMSVWLTDVICSDRGLHRQSKSILREWLCWYQFRQCWWSRYSALAPGGNRLSIDVWSSLWFALFFTRLFRRLTSFFLAIVDVSLKHCFRWDENGSDGW